MKASREITSIYSNPLKKIGLSLSDFLSTICCCESSVTPKNSWVPLSHSLDPPSPSKDFFEVRWGMEESPSYLSQTLTHLLKTWCIRIFWREPSPKPITTGVWKLDVPREPIWENKQKDRCFYYTGIKRVRDRGENVILELWCTVKPVKLKNQCHTLEIWCTVNPMFDKENFICYEQQIKRELKRIHISGWRWFWVCDGWSCDLEPTGDPSMLRLIRSAAALERMWSKCCL